MGSQTASQSPSPTPGGATLAQEESTLRSSASSSSVPSPAQAMTRAPVKAVEFRIRIQEDYDNIVDDVAGFSATFKSGLSTALGVEQERIDILGLSRGSIVVDWRIRDPPAGQTAIKSAEEAANRFEALMTSNNFAAFPDAIRSTMSESKMESRTVSQATAPAAGTVELAPLQDGYMPPTGCMCVANTAAGVRMGCANHLGLDKPWCPVNMGCPGARVGTGVQYRWAYCKAVAVSAASTTGMDDWLDRPIAGSASKAGMVSAARFWLALPLPVALAGLRGLPA